MEQQVVSLLVATVLSVLSILFAIIALSTPGWRGTHDFRLFREHDTTTAGVLLILAIILLAVCLILLIVFTHRFVPQPTKRLKGLLLAFATLAGIFIVAAYADVTTICIQNAYSYQLAVVSGIFTFLSTIAISYWLGCTSTTGWAHHCSCWLLFRTSSLWFVLSGFFSHNIVNLYAKIFLSSPWFDQWLKDSTTPTRRILPFKFEYVDTEGEKERYLSMFNTERSSSSIAFTLSFPVNFSLLQFLTRIRTWPQISNFHRARTRVRSSVSIRMIYMKWRRRRETTSLNSEYMYIYTYSNRWMYMK